MPLGSYVALWQLFSTSGSITESGLNYDSKLKEELSGHITQSGTVVYTIPLSNWISLNGGASLAFEGLPAGLEFIGFGTSNNETSPPPFTTAAGIMDRGSSSDAAKSICTWGVHGPTTENCSTVSPTFQNINGFTTGGFLKIIDFLSTLQFALSTTLNIGGDVSLYAGVYKNLKSTGNFDIYNAVTNDSSNVVTGHVTTLSAPSLLDQLATVQIYNSGGLLATPTITSQSPTSLTFTWPSLASGNYLLIGTEFGGHQYVLGPFVYILADPSGLYQIVTGKTNDTLYVDHSTMTQNVAIPNPFIKTGFLDGQ